ncbi:MAG TPA: hypothetical protein VGG15_08980 [Terriglobales bacterium]|jgi:hypothetical protein
MSPARPVFSRKQSAPRDSHAQPGLREHSKTARVLPFRNKKVVAPAAALSEQPLWLWPNLLSLDAPLIAVLWLHLLAVSGQIRISPVISVALGLAVWLIYVADRLLDGLRPGASALSARHQFYRAHRRTWFSVLLGALALACCLCLELDARTLLFGTLLMLAVAGYFAAVHQMREKWRLHFPKEAVVAVVFGIGTFFPAWPNARGSNAAMAITLGLFVAICWLNIVLIEYAEWVSLRQRSSETPHVSTLAAGQHLSQIGATVSIVVFGLAQLRTTEAQHPVLLTISLSALALTGLGFCWHKFSNNMVRVLADATLLTPAIALMFLRR